MFDTVFRPHSYPLAPIQKGFTLLELLVVMARYPTMLISVGGLVTLVLLGFVSLFMAERCLMTVNWILLLISGQLSDIDAQPGCCPA